jgi:hypothetical protein
MRSSPKPSRTEVHGQTRFVEVFHSDVHARRPWLTKRKPLPSDSLACSEHISERSAQRKRSLPVQVQRVSEYCAPIPGVAPVDHDKTGKLLLERPHNAS